MGEDHDMPPSACLACGDQMDSANCVDENIDDAPSPGDITVCLHCGHVMAFDDELKLRELNAQEAYEIAGDKRILAIQATRAKVMKEHKT